jgi:hypothetical protein
MEKKQQFQGRLSCRLPWNKSSKPDTTTPGKGCMRPLGYESRRLTLRHGGIPRQSFLLLDYYYVPVSLVNPNPIHVENEDLLLPLAGSPRRKTNNRNWCQKQKDQHSKLSSPCQFTWMGKNKLKSRFFSYFNRKREEMAQTHTHTHTGAQTLE